MNANVSPLNLITRARCDEPTAEDDPFAYSDELAFRYDVDDATLWCEWSPRGIPCFGPDLLRDLERGSEIIEATFGRSAGRPLAAVVLTSAREGVFNLGGDLGYFSRAIAEGDRPALERYARTATRVVWRNHAAHNQRGATTIALLEGDALGGGLECALSCDVVVAERQVKAGFPEVLFDMFPGMGGLSFLGRRVNRSVADELSRSGRMFTALDLKAMGVVDAVVAPGEGRAAVEAIVRERRQRPSSHAAMNVVDRMIRPVTQQELDDVAALWVDCAMSLPARGIAWMRRLHERQLQIFGAHDDRRVAGAASFAAAA